MLACGSDSINDVNEQSTSIHYVALPVRVRPIWDPAAIAKQSAHQMRSEPFCIILASLRQVDASGWNQLDLPL